MEGAKSEKYIITTALPCGIHCKRPSTSASETQPTHTTHDHANLARIKSEQEQNRTEHTRTADSGRAVDEKRGPAVVHCLAKLSNVVEHVKHAPRVDLTLATCRHAVIWPAVKPKVLHMTCLCRHCECECLRWCVCVCVCVHVCVCRREIERKRKRERERERERERTREREREREREKREKGYVHVGACMHARV